MKEVFECGTCGVVSDASVELCAPRQVNGIEDYCGTAGESAEMCGIMLKSLKYECNACGRAAEEADLVCDPIRIR
jgi:hypothetical protein